MSDYAFTRRGLIAATGAACFSSAPRAAAPKSSWPLTEGTATPKLCMLSGPGADERAMRRITQLGVKHAIMSGPRIPWEESQLRQIMDHFQKGGLTVSNMMIGGFPNTIYGKPGRDQEIENIQKSIRAAGRAGLPVIEYNFYAHRAIEGYYDDVGRGGAGTLSFDYDKIKDLPPLPEEGAHSLDEMWANVTYFLKAAIPVAEKAGTGLGWYFSVVKPPVVPGTAKV